MKNCARKRVSNRKLVMPLSNFRCIQKISFYEHLLHESTFRMELFQPDTGCLKIP